jgi:hypothetical protein
MYRMGFLGRNKALALIAFLLTIGLAAHADPPECDCTSLLPDVNAFEDCQEDPTSYCSGTDVPVNGNIWFLAAMGVGLAGYGYYKEKLDKKDGTTDNC